MSRLDDRAAQILYGTPPRTRGYPRRLSCGHGRGRAIVARNLRTAWCWECEDRVRMVRVTRFWKRWTTSRS